MKYSHNIKNIWVFIELWIFSFCFNSTYSRLIYLLGHVGRMRFILFTDFFHFTRKLVCLKNTLEN